MEAGMQGTGSPPQPHQDDRLREQLMHEREEAVRRRDQMVAEMEAMSDHIGREVDRCDRVVHGCTLALEAIDPPKLAMSVPPDSANQQAFRQPSGAVIR